MLSAWWKRCSEMQREGHRERQREQDRDRVQPRLELRREDQVHEDERQPETRAGSSPAVLAVSWSDRRACSE